MKLLRVAAIVATVLSGSVLAGVVPQYGDSGNHGGDGNDSGPSSELNIYQYGGGDSAFVPQTNARNSGLTITRHGDGNGVNISWGSDDSSIGLTQRSFGNSAILDQWSGKNSEMTAKQFDGGNGTTVDQAAFNSSVSVAQVGSGNSAITHQY